MSTPADATGQRPVPPATRTRTRQTSGTGRDPQRAADAQANRLHLRYAWAVGQLIILFSALYITINLLLFRGTSVKAYRFLYVGALVSYGIVVFNSLGVPRGGAWFRRAFVDENVQYLMMVLYWLTSKPVVLSIFPFATYSVFHCLSFFRHHVLTLFYPPGTVVQSGQRPPDMWAGNLAWNILLWSVKQFDPAMVFVAYAELATLPYLVVLAVLRRGSLLAPILYAHFLRFRYHHAQPTQNAVYHLVSRVDNALAQQSPAVRHAWDTVKKVITAWGAPTPAATAAAQQRAAQGPAGAPGADAAPRR